MTDASTPDPAAVRGFLEGLQDEICAGLERVDGTPFRRDEMEARGGKARPRVLTGGPILEKAAVNFSHTRGDALPAAATDRRPDLAGRPFEAVSVSLITHPRNPYAPTSHANFRFFATRGDDPVWWFGGGYDLTPYYGFDEDALHWHRTARAACDPFGEELYPRFKQGCDEYFLLPHRAEPRGIGGLFWDDLDLGGFDRTFAFQRSVASSYLAAYLPILERRAPLAYGERERDFQLYRRGRYVEFNLLYDRGTRYGLQAGGRTESILASLPPLARWEYDYQAEEGSDEARLLTEYLTPRDWLGE